VIKSCKFHRVANVAKCQHDRMRHRFVVFRHVSQRSDSWKFAGDHHHFYDNFMNVWDLIFFSSVKIYILFSRALFYGTFSWVLSDVSRTRPAHFLCILKLQIPGCSQNSLTGNKNMFCLLFGEDLYFIFVCFHEYCPIFRGLGQPTFLVFWSCRPQDAPRIL